MIAFNAMRFAHEAHAGQVRKYTGNPYTDHLAEVAGIVSTVSSGYSPYLREVTIATAWLHDVREDQGVSHIAILSKFGPEVAHGVHLLSDLEKGDRATRKRLARERLAFAPAWVKTIKIADLLSNAGSIIKHDPQFAVVYVRESRMLLDVLKSGVHSGLVAAAQEALWQNSIS